MESVTREYLNNVSKSIWSFASHYGHERELLAEAEAGGELWGWLGPTRCTAIIACVPAYTDASGLSSGRTLRATAGLLLSKRAVCSPQTWLPARLPVLKSAAAASAGSRIVCLPPWAIKWRLAALACPACPRRS